MQAHARERKRCEVNFDPRSEDTWRGIACFENTCDTRYEGLCNIITSTRIRSWNKNPLERWSMTTKIAAYPSDGDIFSMEPMPIDWHGRSGVAEGRKAGDVRGYSARREHIALRKSCNRNVL